MRLNAVWGLEPNETSIDILKAQVDPEEAQEGGVVYDCINTERQMYNEEIEDSDLDKMIYLFQS